MTSKTKNIIKTIAAQNGVTPEFVEKEMKNAIREAMKSTDPRARELWNQLAPDGAEPDIETFLKFCADSCNER